MPISEADLRDLLVERTTTQPLVTDRLDRVHGRIVRRRRRRLVAAVVSIVAVLAAAAGVTLPDWTGGTSTPAVSGTPAGPPEYFGGGKLVATTQLHSPEQASVSVTITPTNWQLGIRLSCDGAPWHGDFAVEAVNGHVADMTGCAAGGATAWRSDSEQTWRSLGVEPGKPSTITVVLASQDAVTKGSFLTTLSTVAPSPLPVAQRPTGTVTVAIYQGVPADQYVFPPRPTKLAPLPTHGPGTMVLDARTDGENGRWTVPVTVSDGEELSTDTVAPGALSFAVDGKLVDVCDSWDYGQAGCAVGFDRTSLAKHGVDVHDGQRLDVVVTASRFADPAWVVFEAHTPFGRSDTTAGPIG